MLSIVLFGAVAVGVPYLVRRSRPGAVWGFAAYFLGLLTTFLALFAALLAMALLRVPPEQANRVFGPFGIAELVGPIVGVVLAGRRSAAQVQFAAHDTEQGV